MNKTRNRREYVKPAIVWVEVETHQSVMAASDENGYGVSGSGSDNGWAGARRREVATPRTFWETETGQTMD